MIANALDRLGSVGVTPGIAEAAIAEVYDPSRGEWWRREWESARKRVLRERFPQWFKAKKQKDGGLFDKKDQTQWTQT